MAESGKECVLMWRERFETEMEAIDRMLTRAIADTRVVLEAENKPTITSFTKRVDNEFKIAVRKLWVQFLALSSSAEKYTPAEYIAAMNAILPIKVDIPIDMDKEKKCREIAEEVFG